MNLRRIKGFHKSQKRFDHLHNFYPHISTQELEFHIKLVKCFIPVSKGFVSTFIATIRFIVVTKTFDNNQWPLEIIIANFKFGNTCKFLVFVTIIRRTHFTRDERKETQHGGIGTILIYVTKYFQMRMEAYNLCKYKKQGL
jgi:hypothetical protein